MLGFAAVDARAACRALSSREGSAVALLTLSQGALHLGQARAPCVPVSRVYLARHERWQTCRHGRRVALSVCELMMFEHTGQSGKLTLHIGASPCCLAASRHCACARWPHDRRGILSCAVGLLHLRRLLGGRYVLDFD
jgi:hypothetical protein